MLGARVGAELAEHVDVYPPGPPCPSRRLLVGQVWRDLTVVDALDREREMRVFRRRGDRVRALGLIAVLGGQANIDVLARDVARPIRYFEDQGGRARRLGLQPGDAHDAPRQ